MYGYMHVDGRKQTGKPVYMHVNNYAQGETQRETARAAYINHVYMF